MVATYRARPLVGSSIGATCSRRIYVGLVLALAALLLVPFNASIEIPYGSSDGIHFRVDHLVLVRNQLFAGYVNGPTTIPVPHTLQSGIVSRVLYPQHLSRGLCGGCRCMSCSD